MPNHKKTITGRFDKLMRQYEVNGGNLESAVAILAVGEAICDKLKDLSLQIKYVDGRLACVVEKLDSIHAAIGAKL